MQNPQPAHSKPGAWAPAAGALCDSLEGECVDPEHGKESFVIHD